jgi:adenine-specific DNA methylase
MRTAENRINQLDFFQNEEWVSLAYLPISRPIHYLGSKLRIINYVRNTIDEADPSGGPVCDLFAGSGTVSLALSQTRNVIAVDIQEYSRVLCSALLKPINCETRSVERFIESTLSSKHSKTLSWAIEPLTNHEMKCMHVADNGNLEPLCELLENGSLIKFEQNACAAKDSSLVSALKETDSRLRQVNMVSNPRALAIRYFGGIYFSYQQASQIDMILEAVAPLPMGQKDIFLAALLSTSSEVVNTIGKQFAQPLRPRLSSGKPKPELSRLVSRDRFVSVIDEYRNWLHRYLATPKTNRPHIVIRSDYKEALKRLRSKVSVVYADPPYTRDHYSRYYHVLETLCLRDNPTISTMRTNGKEQLSRGIYRADRYQSEFCIKSKAPVAFSELFSDVRQLNVPLVLSYSPYAVGSRSRPRLMTIEEILIIAKEYFGQIVELTPGRIAHSKLTNAEKTVEPSYDAEILLVCKP